MKSEKFLKFNEKSIYFQSYDGQFWIAIKPICDALNIDYSRQLRTIKSDDILSELWSLQTMVGADNKIREMASLPEMYIYGWIFSVQSQSAELKEYKKDCYNILFNYFHGTITGRKNLLKEKVQVNFELAEAENQLAENEAFIKIQNLKKKQTTINGRLKSNDNQAMKEVIDLFSIEQN